MKTIILFFLFILFSFSIIAQNNKKGKSTLKSEVYDMFYDYFRTSADIEFQFNVFSSSFVLDFENLPTPKLYDEKFFQEISSQLKKDFLNPIPHSEMAEYYKAKGDFEKMIKHYELAKSKMDLKYFEDNTAGYFSFLGLLKMNLGDTTYLKDFEWALQLNPSDPVAEIFYPMALMSQKDYFEVATILKGLIKEGATESIYYFQIRFNEVVYCMKKIMESEENQSYEFINNTFSILGKEKIEISDKNLQIAVDEILDQYRALFLWSYFHNLEMAGKPRDEKNYMAFKSLIGEKIKRVTELYRQGIINEFLYHKTVGYYYLFANNGKKMTHHLTKAIAFFPAHKRDFSFHETDIYSALASIATLEKKHKLALRYVNEFLKDQNRVDYNVFESNRVFLLMSLGKHRESTNEAIRLYNKNHRGFYVLFVLFMDALKNEYYDQADELLPQLEQSISSEKQHYLALIFVAATFYIVGQEEHALNILAEAEEFNKLYQVESDENKTMHTKLKNLIYKYK